jgi:hypothetical protein
VSTGKKSGTSGPFRSVEEAGVPGLVGGQARGDREAFLRLLDREQGPWVDAHAGVLERECRLDEEEDGRLLEVAELGHRAHGGVSGSWSRVWRISTWADSSLKLSWNRVVFWPW